ncbi:MAG: MraY family glycosyltransferase [Phycisphaerales bacterium]|nr:MraY family glycosyltransferase [Phycisphaerales bacterium]
MIHVVLILLSLATVLSFCITGALCALGKKAGTFDSAGVSGHEKELRQVPNIGGIAIWSVLVFPLIGGLLLLKVAPEALTTVLVDLSPWTAQLTESTPLATAFVLCVTALHFMGLIDDRKPLGVLPKTIVEIACASTLVLWFDVRMLEVLDVWFGTGSILSITLTICWILVLTNALNYLDNMDGITAGITVVSAGLFMITALQGSQWFVGATLGLLVGGCLGFLWWNKPKAKIFMGDGGSLVIGFSLAVLVTRVTWYDPTSSSGIGTAWYGVLMPIFVLALPLYDFITVTSLRVLQGKSPFKGDQQHFSHRLSQQGLSGVRVLLILMSISLLTGIAGYLLGRSNTTQAVLLTAFVATVLLIVAYIDFSGRKGEGKS